MPDILQDFPIGASLDRVFEAIATPSGLDAWWTKTCAGEPRVDALWELGFGPDYQWQARVTRYERPVRFELEFVQSDADWNGTTVSCELGADGGATLVQFAHRGWPTENSHFRISCHCWALYLRVLRRWVEHGERVAYEDRLGV